MEANFQKKLRKKQINPEPYKTMVYGRKPLNPSMQVYWYKRKPIKKKKKKIPKSRAKHDQAWKPNNPGKKGKLGTLDGKFPEYICNPPKYFRRRNKKKE
jgi:hypothetical protein